MTQYCILRFYNVWYDVLSEWLYNWWKMIIQLMENVYTSFIKQVIGRKNKPKISHPHPLYRVFNLNILLIIDICLCLMRTVYTDWEMWDTTLRCKANRTKNMTNLRLLYWLEARKSWYESLTKWWTYHCVTVVCFHPATCRVLLLLTPEDRSTWRELQCRKRLPLSMSSNFLRKTMTESVWLIE